MTVAAGVNTRPVPTTLLPAKQNNILSTVSFDNYDIGSREFTGGLLRLYICIASCILWAFFLITLQTLFAYTVVPALGDPRRERPPAVYGHFVNVPTHFNAKLPVLSGHLPNADADSHLLVVSTCYNGQCKQMPRFRWSFQPKIACARPKLATVSSLKFPCCRLVTNEQYQRDAASSRVMNHVIAANQPIHWLRLLYDITSEKSRIMFVQPAMSKNRTILSFDQ